ncbi:MAG: hypothetical protein IK130_07950 [Oscillospiraceae bacterium]|nr:hypothetical protein [Oscillospiraceae bacterium]
MFERLTEFLPALEKDSGGTWWHDTENDGSPEHPRQMSYVQYSDTVRIFRKAVYQFVEAHPELHLHEYSDVLRDAGLRWDMDSMQNADVSALDGKTVTALLLAADRAERFCEGAWFEFYRAGCITKWLTRLQQIDAE